MCFELLPPLAQMTLEKYKVVTADIKLTGLSILRSAWAQTSTGGRKRARNGNESLAIITLKNKADLLTRLTSRSLHTTRLLAVRCKTDLCVLIHCPLRWPAFWTKFHFKDPSTWDLKPWIPVLGRLKPLNPAKWKWRQEYKVGRGRVSPPFSLRIHRDRRTHSVWEFLEVRSNCGCSLHLWSFSTYLDIWLWVFIKTK